MDRAEFLESSHRLFAIVCDGEDGVKFGDLEEFLDLRGQVAKVHGDRSLFAFAVKRHELTDHGRGHQLDAIHVDEDFLDFSRLGEILQFATNRADHLLIQDSGCLKIENEDIVRHSLDETGHEILQKNIRCSCNWLPVDCSPTRRGW